MNQPVIESIEETRILFADEAKTILKVRLAGKGDRGSPNDIVSSIEARNSTSMVDEIWLVNSKTGRIESILVKKQNKWEQKRDNKSVN